MAYKNADKLSKKLRLLEEQKHGMVKQTNNVSTVITRGSANRDNRSKTTTAATKTYTAPKATTASSYKTGGTTTKYTATPKVAASVPKAPAVSTLAPTFAVPTVLTSSAKQEPKPTQKYDFEGYLSALSALETARAQSVQAQNTYLNTQGLIEKGKEFFRNSGNLAAAQADVQRIAARNSANALTNAAKKAGGSGAVLLGAQANANRTAANTAASAAAKYGKNVWDSYSNNANAYSQSLARQGDATAAAAKNMAKNYSDSANNYSTALTQQGKNVAQFEENSAKFAKRYFVDSHRDFSNNPDAGKIVAQTLGVTGSDQTGASLYGYRNDTRMKEPQKHWDMAALKEYQSLKWTNEKDAERFAISVNEDYHKKQSDTQRQEQLKKIKLQIEDDYYASLHSIGARAAAPMKGLDSYNSLLEYAATGKMSNSPNLTLGEYSQAVDDAISNRLEREHGKLASGAYQLWTEAFDGMTTYGVGGPTADILRSAGDSSFDALNRARNSGATDKQAAEYAFWNGAGSAAVDVGVGVLYEKKYIQKPKTQKEKLENEKTHAFETSTASVGKTLVDAIEQQILFDGSRDYQKIVDEYKNKGYSDRHAKHIAVFEMMKKSGMNALKDVALEPQQRAFYETLQRAWKTGK